MALSDIAEATPDTSSEEIAAYAAQVVKEVAEERMGEPDEKSDSQITAEHSGTVQSSETNETSAENNSGEETATDDGEETGSESEGPKWMTDAVKAEAAAYGIDESDLADFASREELDRALRLFDKKALEAGRKAESEPAQARDEKGKFVKKEEPKTEPIKEETPKNGRYEVTLNPDLYDDEIIGEFSRMRDHYESRLEVLEAHFAESREQAEHQRFDSLVDALGHEDLFGKTGAVSDEEFQRRDKLFTELKYYISGREKYGVPTKLDKQTISNVADMVFAKELKTKELKQKTRKISKQSDGRMGGSPTKPIPPSDSAADRFDRLYKQMQS